MVYRNNRLPHLAWWNGTVVCMTIIFTQLTGPLQAKQFFGRADRSSESQEETLGSYPYDRNLANQFDRFKKQLDQKNYADAFEGLDAILAGEKDSALKPVKGKEKYVSVKREVNRLIGTLDQDGLAAYRLQFGAAANRALQTALQTNSNSALTEVIRRYYHTDAGYQAAFLLGRAELDRGQPLAAAQLFQGLYEAVPARMLLGNALIENTAIAWARGGQPQRTVDLLNKAVADDSKLQFLGKPWIVEKDVKLAVSRVSETVSGSVGASRAQDRQWTMFRGNVARNVGSSGGAPLLNPRWQADVITNPQLGLRLYEDRKGFLNQGLPAIPALQSLAVGPYVIFRTPLPQQPITAVDFETGKLSWFVARTAPSGGQNQDLGPNSPLSERAWSNLNYGGLSSDGQRVFFVEEDSSGSSGKSHHVHAQIMMQRRGWAGPFGMNGEETLGMQTSNRLSACGIATQGKLEWVVGGPTGEMEPRLAGVTFLGAPLPLHGQLYVMTEAKQSIALNAIDPATGKLLWQQELLLLDEQTLGMFSHFRQIAGIMPTYAEGMLICPTGTGNLVAVDLVQRTIAWTFQPVEVKNNNRYEQFNSAMMYGTGQLAPGSTWADCTPIAAAGHIVIGVSETDKLYCLDLLTGAIKWNMPREQNLYVGGVVNEQVLLVGRKQVSAVSLKDKQPLWKQVANIPDGAVTSGRGFVGDDAYFLPTSAGEVLKIALSDGTIAMRGQSLSRSIPGNLICYRGHVISLGIDRVEKYPQTELLKSQVTERLARDPQDWQALAWSGEIALDNGNYEEAEKVLRSADKGIKAATDNTSDDVRQLARLTSEAERIRSLLFGVLVVKVRRDPVKQSALLADLERLSQSNTERATWLRLSADVALARGNTAEALSRYLELDDIQPASEDLEQLDLLHEVRREAWLHSRLSALWASLPVERRDDWKEQLQRRLTVAVADPNKTVERLQRFLRMYHFHPVADQAREKLLSALGSEDALQSERLLYEYWRGNDLARQKEAAARLASLYQSSSRTEAAAKFYRILGQRFGDDICLENQTGKQWIESVPTDTPLGKLLAGGVDWPSGVVEETRPSRDSSSGRNSNGNFPMLWRVQLKLDQADSPLAGCQLLLDQNQNELLLRDARGQTMQRLSLNTDQTTDFGINAGYLRAAARDHLLLVDVGWRVVAYSLLPRGTPSRAKPVNQPIWHYDYGNYNALQMQAQTGNGVLGFKRYANWGVRRLRIVNPNGNSNISYGELAIAGNRGIVVHRQREASLLDPLTGKPIWIRRGLPENCDLAADESTVTLIPAVAGTKAVVLSTVDGGKLREIDLPPRDSIIHIYGTTLLHGVTADGKNRLRRINAADGSVELIGEYAIAEKQGVRVAVADHEFGVMRANTVAGGKTTLFEVYDTATGKLRFASPVVHEGNLLEIKLQRTSDQYLLLVRGADMNRANTKYQFQPSYHDGDNHPLWTGTLHAFNHAGVAQWSAPGTLYQHFLWPVQPIESPVLIFARMAMPVKNRNGNAMLSLLILDKRTGRLLYENDELPGQTQGMDIQIDSSRKQVQVQFPHHDGNQWQRVALAWTDKPRPPEAAYQEGMQASAAAASQNKATGLFRSLFRALDSAGENIVTPVDPLDIP